MGKARKCEWIGALSWVELVLGCVTERLNLFKTNKLPQNTAPFRILFHFLHLRRVYRRRREHTRNVRDFREDIEL
jgi:hypothetical protein